MCSPVNNCFGDHAVDAFGAVDCLRDPKIGRQAAQRIGIFTRQVSFFTQQHDHVTQRFDDTLIEIGIVIMVAEPEARTQEVGKRRRIK